MGVARGILDFKDGKRVAGCGGRRHHLTAMIRNGRRTAIVGLLVMLCLAACTSSSPQSRQAVREALASEPEPVAGHPRLWITRDDVARLRADATDDNPAWRDGLAPAAARAKQSMDDGEVRKGDGGGEAYEVTWSETFAELFAFLSLVSPHSADRADYGSRARRLLMRVIDEAAKGPAEDKPFRSPGFSIRDRSRWAGEAFALTLDWAYPYFSADDKETIRKVFLRWAAENEKADTTSNNHPEPPGVVNDPVLIRDPTLVRWAGNNYYAAHMRNIGLMALALDEGDDPDSMLRRYLERATGAWLYVVDHMLRTDGRGGLLPEGFEYGPQTAGYVAQFLLALETSGQADPQRYGRQVDWNANPFWDQFLDGLVHSLSPQAVWYGDGQRYEAPAMIGSLAPLALHWKDDPRAARDRWIEQELVAGGRDKLLERAANPGNEYLTSILTYLLLDPAAPVGPDPRPAMPTTHTAPGLGAVLARTGWGQQNTLFTYRLGYISIDHQHADGNQIELLRNGEWLTKERTGYGDNIAASDYHNTVAIQNDRPDHYDSGDYRKPLWERGSQWLVGDNDGDGRIVAQSEGDGYLAVTGDATALYNSTYEKSTDVVHASRSAVWLKPDTVVVYDRAETRTDRRFKRFWLNLPAPARVDGRTATVETKGGQRLSVQTLLPDGASLRSEKAEALEADREPAENEPMTDRLRVEAPGGPRAARFLHVLDAGDRSGPAATTSLVRSTAGRAMEGAVAADTAVLFPVNLGDAGAEVAYEVPGSVRRHVVSGLVPNARYGVALERVGNAIRVRVTSDGDRSTDGGGVLLIV
jgi:hypothetical protein